VSAVAILTVIRVTLCPAALTNEEIQSFRLEEMRHAMFAVKKMSQSVRRRKEQNLKRTKEAFSVLRKVIDKREEQMMTSIVKAADKRERALKVGIYFLYLSIVTQGRS